MVGTTENKDSTCFYGRSRFRGSEVKRHDEIKQAFAQTLRAWGLSVILEPTFYEYADGSLKRPDFTVIGADNHVLVADVTVVDPAAESHVRSGVKGPGTCAKEVAQQKIVKHSQAVESYGHTFYPLAMEAYGTMDEGIDKFLRRCAMTLPPQMRPIFMYEVRSSVAVALQAGNARIAASALRRSAAL